MDNIEIVYALTNPWFSIQRQLLNPEKGSSQL